MRNQSRYERTARITRGGHTHLAPRISRRYADKVDDLLYDVQTGDTLQHIAHRFLGSAQFWWVVADFNEIVDGFQELPLGTTLRIPSTARLWMEVLV